MLYTLKQTFLKKVFNIPFSVPKQVFAFNSVGRSDPAVVMVNPTMAKRRTIPPFTDEPEYQPEFPQETLLCKFTCLTASLQALKFKYFCQE